jgi:hypothetical protein
MLQTIKKTCKKTCNAAGVKIAWGLTLGMMIAGASWPAAATAQNPAPADQTPQTSTAAPGTAPVPKATAAALAVYTGPKYNNRWEIYGGLNFANGQAGQNLPKRYNMGGAEVMGTYWLGGPKDGFLRRHLGLAADYRFQAGTTPVISPFYNRVVAMQSIFSGGLEYRGPKNRYAAIDLHALGGGSDGIFNYATNHYPGGSPTPYCPVSTPTGYNYGLGLYCNHVAPWGAAGGSIEFNESAKLAIRLQPDIVFEHFGTETREFVSVSLGAVYRFGKK